MRRAELVLALVMAALSVGLMWKSMELPVGWIPGEGPGGGAFPFWLSAGMLVCCAWTLVRWLRRPGSPGSGEGAPGPEGGDPPYFVREARSRLFLVIAAVAAMIGLVHVIGVYGSVPLFLLFYLRVLGRHGWMVAGAFAIATPVLTFFFFEAALRITLPKGYTEPLFYPLYDWFL